MEEAFSKSASNLMPLLVLIAVVFGGLIVLAMVLKARVRRDTAGPVTKRRGSVLELAPDDVLSVLGRSFVVEDVQTLSGPELPGLWCALRADDGVARTAIGQGLGVAVQFPGREPYAAAPFPDQIDRDEGTYARQGPARQFGQAHRLALYRGPGDRWIALEELGAETTLWRGKEIPPEGLVVLEEREAS